MYVRCMQQRTDWCRCGWLFCCCCVLMQMTKKVLCMNPGPIEFEQRVLKEFSAEGISHVDKTVIEVFGQALEKMRKVRLRS